MSHCNRGRKRSAADDDGNWRSPSTAPTTTHVPSTATATARFGFDVPSFQGPRSHSHSHYNGGRARASRTTPSENGRGTFDFEGLSLRSRENKNYQPDPEVRLWKLSKSLSWLLRNLEKEGLTEDSDGFVDLFEVLSHPQFRNWSNEDVRECVKEFGEKCGLALKEETLDETGGGRGKIFVKSILAPQLRQSRQLQLSKSLTWLLRYSVESEGLQKDAEGFVNLADVLLHPQFKQYSEQDVRNLIGTEQERFALKEDENRNAVIKARPPEYGSQGNKGLAWILRHGAEKESLPIDEQGFVELAALLKHPKFTGRWTEQDIRQLMEIQISKGVPRYEIKRDGDSGKDFIRSYHGHSISLPKAYEELGAPILEEDPALVPVPVAIHRLEKWEYIKEKGLSRKSEKLHIWFRNVESEFTLQQAESGKKIFIYVDMMKAMKDGYKFYRAGNNILGTPGNEGGFLPPKYFKKVVVFKTGEELEFNRD